MEEWFTVNTSITNLQFLVRHKEIKRLSFCIAEHGSNGRLWVQDEFENTVLIISDNSEGSINGRIIEVRCYAPNNPSYILYLLIEQEGCLIMPRDYNFYDPPKFNQKDFAAATAKLLQQIKRNKSYKAWEANISK
jgi:hypothetical protein